MVIENAVIGTIDCSYHVMWISLCQAISDYGIKEINSAVDRATGVLMNEKAGVNGEGSTPATSASNPPQTVKAIPPEVAHMVEAERVITTEAFKSATRIAGLVRILKLHIRCSLTSTNPCLTTI